MKIGFIGFGNMASAICEGLIKSGFNNNDIYASSLHYDKLIQRTNKYHINPLKDNNSVAKTCDVIILGVKPFQMEQVINEISDKYLIKETKEKNVEIKSKFKVQIDENAEYNFGDKVKHDQFGIGVVVGIDKSILKVAFPAPFGIKTLIKGHKSIQKL